MLTISRVFVGAGRQTALSFLEIFLVFFYNVPMLVLAQVKPSALKSSLLSKLSFVATSLARNSSVQ